MPALFTREGREFKARPTTNDRGQVGYFPGWRRCPRCSGAGGASKWQFTGWRCYECGNENHVTENGETFSVVSSDRFVRLYTAERLAVLNERQARADAKRAVKAAELAAAEAARVAAEREAIVAAPRELLDRIAAVADVTADGFLGDVYRQVTERAGALTEGQRSAVERTVAAREAEIARRAKATHVGTVGDRVELELTYVGKYDITEAYYGAPARFIWTFRTADGCTVKYIGGYAKALDPLGGEKGATVRVVATIKAHDEYKGEPQTVIQRPAPVKVAA
jgi:hypothetical protein